MEVDQEIHRDDTQISEKDSSPIVVEVFPEVFTGEEESDKPVTSQPTEVEECVEEGVDYVEEVCGDEEEEEEEQVITEEQVMSTIGQVSYEKFILRYDT